MKNRLQQQRNKNQIENNVEEKKQTKEQENFNNHNTLEQLNLNIQEREKEKAINEEKDVQNFQSNKNMIYFRFSWVKSRRHEKAIK